MLTGTCTNVHALINESLATKRTSYDVREGVSAESYREILIPGTVIIYETAIDKPGCKWNRQHIYFFHKSSMISLEKICLSVLSGYFFHFFAWLGLKGQPMSLKSYTLGDRELEYCTRHLRWPYLSLIDINKLNYLYTVCRLKAANSENTICHTSAAKENIPKRKPHRRLRL